jgi:hypothetical protein
MQNPIPDRGLATAEGRKLQKLSENDLHRCCKTQPI